MKLLEMRGWRCVNLSFLPNFNNVIKFHIEKNLLYPVGLEDQYIGLPCDRYFVDSGYMIPDTNLGTLKG